MAEAIDIGCEKLAQMLWSDRLRVGGEGAPGGGVNEIHGAGSSVRIYRARVRLQSGKTQSHSIRPVSNL